MTAVVDLAASAAVAGYRRWARRCYRPAEDMATVVRTSGTTATVTAMTYTAACTVDRVEPTDGPPHSPRERIYARPPLGWAERLMCTKQRTPVVHVDFEPWSRVSSRYRSHAVVWTIFLHKLIQSVILCETRNVPQYSRMHKQQMGTNYLTVNKKPRKPRKKTRKNSEASADTSGCHTRRMFPSIFQRTSFTSFQLIPPYTGHSLITTFVRDYLHISST